MNKPLSEIFRPKNLKDVVGQEHITADDKILDRIIKKNSLTSMIFYGPPGVGKTTCANILAQNLNAHIYKFNATYNKTEEVKNVIHTYREENIANIRPIIYVDEIQNYNKRQQQIFLEFIENGTITFIGSTTENPNHYIYPALLSRCTVLEFYKVSKEKIIQNLKNCISLINEEEDFNIQITGDALENIAIYSDMDVRRSINLLEIIINLYSQEKNIIIDANLLKEIGISRQFAYDMNGDEYYDLLSAFHKSIRGSDENAALFYLARAIKAGDIKPICRRLLVIASEDIGLAYPMASVIVKSCVDSALFLGLPEARIPLAQATILLATSPKSNSAYLAITNVLDVIEEKGVGVVPNHLKDAHYKGASKLGRGTEYKYAHDYKNSYVKQQYLPDTHKDDVYYFPKDNKFENEIKNYWKNIKGET